ncbi:MAG: PAS domain S-box protein [Candidatus Schekmanbacteria bacterium]|nr:PAS domain S-box protein [Candidatus Schekmanbacteria bacterium]
MGPLEPPPSASDPPPRGLASPSTPGGEARPELSSAELSRLHAVVRENRDAILQKVLALAHRHGYAQYLSTLPEDWRQAVQGLADAVLATHAIPALGPDERHAGDAGAELGIREARLHRGCGVTLSMFLGLIKLYREAYRDVVFADPVLAGCAAAKELAERFFDRVEIAFATEWAGSSAEEQIHELARLNREHTSERNRYVAIFESLITPVLVFSLDGQLVAANRAATELLGDARPPAADCGDRLAAVAAAVRWLQQDIAALAASNETSRSVEREVPIRGQTRELEIRVQRDLDLGHSIVGVIVTISDVTERRQRERDLSKAGEELRKEIAVRGTAERELRVAHANLQEFKALLDRATDGILVLDHASGRIEDSNRTAAAMVGLEVSDLVGQNLADIFRASAADLDWSIVRERIAAVPSVRVPAACQSCEQGERALEVALTLVVPDAEAQPRVVAMIRDISERTRLEHHLHQAQKLEAIGTLAAGIAHEFNNSLQAILGLTKFALRDVPAGSRASEDLGLVLKSVAGAADLTRKILALGRQQEMSMRRLEVGPTIREIWSLLERLLEADVAMGLEEGNDLGVVEADSGQLQQILFNLAINARDAMPQGGALRLTVSRLRREQVGELPAHVRLTPGREYVRLRLVDSGTGMPPEVLQRALDPFFTTKPVGSGTGLGLPTALGLIEQHGGALELSSEAGKGTVADVYLPLVGEPPARPEQPAAPPIPRDQRRIAVLLVEDDDVVRLLTERTLREAGFDVVALANGREAIAAVQDRAIVFDAGVFDAVMPDYDGFELFRALRASRQPDIPVIFATGYSPGVIPADVSADPFVQVLRKPFDLPDLLLCLDSLWPGRQTPDSDLSLVDF